MRRIIRYNFVLIINIRYIISYILEAQRILGGPCFETCIPYKYHVYSIYKRMELIKIDIINGIALRELKFPC